MSDAEVTGGGFRDRRGDRRRAVRGATHARSNRSLGDSAGGGAPDAHREVLGLNAHSATQGGMDS